VEGFEASCLCNTTVYVLTYPFVVQLRDAMVTTDGVSKEANRKFWLVDKEGLLLEREQGDPR